MSHQSGITASDTLREKFAEIKDNNSHTRLLTVVIEQESLVAKDQRQIEGSFNQDFDRLLNSLVQPNQSCYYFIRLDITSEIGGSNWLLITWIPEDAKVRDRMLYASSLATLKREFGLGHITREFRAASLDEMTLNAYNKHIQTQAAPPPRTMREEEILEIQSREATADISVDSRHPTLQGLFFPFDENVIEALHLFKKHSVNYIQLEIDHEKERILLSHSEAHVTPEKIQKCIPNNEGRYHVYRFIHEFNHIPCEKVLSIYSVPGYNSAIKQRMVYASCKESVIDHIEKKFGVMFDKKIEITEPTELTSEHLLELLHPVEHQVSSKSQFAKPKLPGAGSRGPRRLVKTTDENS